MLKTLDSVLFKNTNPVGVKYPTTNIKLPSKGFFYGKKELIDKENVSISINNLMKSLEVGNFIQIQNK